MDVFKVECGVGLVVGSPPGADKLSPEVSFDAGSEFNLSFFDQPEDGSTQGFSDPGSVGSASAGSPPPPGSHVPSPLTAPGAGALLLGAPSPGTPNTTTVIVKQGTLNF